MAIQTNSQAALLREHRVLFPVLLFALILGLVFTFIVPPWQHYDEPSHFEFAWLIANRSHLPARGEFDQLVRREIASSMLEHRFFEGMDFYPTLIAQGDPVWIGSSQVNQRSLYYILAAVPLYFIRGADVTYQLYVGRLVSIGFFLITILAAYGVVTEITRPGNPLRWLVPVTIVLIPGFTDLMSAMNDDVGATALFSLFLWSGVHMILHGLSATRIITLAVLALACFWTKNTVAIVVLLLPFPILFGLFRNRRKWISWGILAGITLIAMVTAFSWGDAANWYRVNYPNAPVQTTEAKTPFGKYAFHLPLESGVVPPSLTQVMNSSQIRELQGKSVTLGAWIWASKPVEVRTPILYTDAETVFEQVEVGVEPSYFQFTTTVPENPQRLQIMIAPSRSRPKDDVSVYYDGLVFVEGELHNAPEFEGGRGNQLWVEQKPILNHLRNASAESTWPFVEVWADNFIRDFFPGKSSLILAASLDWSPALWYFKATIQQLVTTFWARFGWGHVTLMGFHPYLLLGILTAMGVTAGVMRLGKRGHTLSWELMIFFGVSLATIWGAAIMRGIGSIISGPIFIPSARYAYPVIIPTAMLLTAGWQSIMVFSGKVLSLSPKVIYVIYLFLFFGITLLSILTIINFYYR
jgi:hypothetical protein